MGVPDIDPDEQDLFERDITEPLREMRHASLDRGPGERRCRMSDERPALTLTEAAKATGVSRGTLRRRLDSGEFLNACRLDGPVGTGTGPWVVPIADLLGAGLTLHSPDDDQSDEDKPDDHRDVDLRIRDLEHELELERARRRAAEAFADERLQPAYNAAEDSFESLLRSAIGHGLEPETDAQFQDFIDGDDDDASRAWFLRSNQS
jgi:hypothetical protein